MLERYVIVERIAVGGMGEVFVARQEGVGGFRRTVVLKKLLPNAEGSDEAARRMLDEARINGALAHENVVTILEVGTENGLPWLALEYVHGENAGTLRSRAAKRGIAIPVVVAARIVADCARGLHHAHEAKDVDGRPLHIIHRDIAPKNLFVRVDGVSKVGDFGIARADDRLSQTATGAVAGTLSYMSPEQLSHAPMTARSDQFSLGIVLWELLTGRRLFQREGPVQTAERILSAKVRAPSRYRPDVPARLDAVVLRMLERDPAARFFDCGEVADAIEDAVPDASPTIGRAAVAAFVEEIAGVELRERQRRIEEGAEQTTRADRPLAFTDPSSSRGVPADSASDAGDRSDLDPTRREGRTPSAPSSPSSPATRQPVVPATLLTAPALPVPTRRFRARWVAAAAVIAAVIVVVALALTPRGPDADALTREYLRDAARVRPLTFREAVVDDAIGWDIPESDAEALAAFLSTLMRERFALWIAHHDKPADLRQRERVDVVARDQALLARVHQALVPWGDAEFRARIFEMWQRDSAVPYRFLPALTHDELQRRVFPNGITYMKDTREQRWSQTARLARRAGADVDRVRAALSPLVDEREALLERYGTAPHDELPGLERRMKDLRARGRDVLHGLVPDDMVDAILAVAFIGIPDTERGEPQIDEKAIVVFGP